MLLRLLKYCLVSIAVLVTLLSSLIAFDYFFPATYEATVDLPGSSSVAIVQLEPMHPYLAEYKRALIIRKPGIADLRVEMFPDTGGYSRTQLYLLSNNLFLVRGFFDSFLIDVNTHTISARPSNLKESGQYLGAFDDTGGKWRFIAASESPEKKLEAGGG